MANTEMENFYCNLSRKELQSLCKKYGLPANKSKSNLAKLLLSCIEKQNLSSLSSRERFGGINEAFFPISSIPPLQLGVPLNSMRGARKDRHGIISCPGEKGNEGNNSHTVECNELDCCVEAKTYDKVCFDGSMYDLQGISHSQFVSLCDVNGFNYKESPGRISGENYSGCKRGGKVEDMPQIQHRDINVDVSPVADAFASSIKSSTKVPSSSFEFYVRSEEGINLCVDLNSGPSDWTRKLKDEICICDKVHNNKFRSLQEDLSCFGESNKQIKSSFPWNINASQIEDGMHTGLYLSSTMRENGQIEFDHPNGDDRSSMSPAVIPCNKDEDTAEELVEDQALVTSKPNSDAQNQIESVTDCNPKNEHTIPFDSDVSDTQIKSACNSIVNSISIGEISPLTLEHQNSKLSNIFCEKSTLQNSCSPANPSIYLGCSSSGSIEMQLSEVASYPTNTSCSPCKDDGFLNLVDPKYHIKTKVGGLTNSSELNHDTCWNLLPTRVEEQARSKIMNGRESSQCSQVDNSSEKNCARFDDLEYEELHKKRQHKDGVDQSDFDKPEAKILRSSRRLSGEVLPRRSMRLVSK